MYVAVETSIIFFLLSSRIPQIVFSLFLLWFFGFCLCLFCYFHLRWRCCCFAIWSQTFVCIIIVCWCVCMSNAPTCWLKHTVGRADFNRGLSAQCYTGSRLVPIPLEALRVLFRRISHTTLTGIRSLTNAWTLFELNRSTCGHRHDHPTNCAVPCIQVLPSGL